MRGRLAFQEVGEDLAVDHLYLHPSCQALRRRAQGHVLDLVALVLQELHESVRRDLLRAPVPGEVPGGGQKRLGLLHGVEERYGLAVVEHDGEQLIRRLRAADYDHVGSRGVHVQGFYPSLPPDNPWKSKRAPGCFTGALILWSYESTGPGVVIPIPTPSGVSTILMTLPSSASLTGAAMCSRLSPLCSTT